MRGIVKRFGGTAALKGVDFEVEPGEIHAILGENGAGKSTLMHVLSGSLRPDDGEILIDGSQARIDSPRSARRLGIAIVHQHFTLVPAFTVAENLALDSRAGRAGGARHSGRSLLDEAGPALDRARSLGWSIPPDARIADLPVGTQQRVEIVKTLATGADVLIFDEPTAVLAGSEVEELFAVLRRLRAEGRAVALIAHKLAEILAVADRVTVLRHGERVATARRADVDARKLAAWMMGAPRPAIRAEAGTDALLEASTPDIANSPPTAISASSTSSARSNHYASPPVASSPSDDGSMTGANDVGKAPPPPALRASDVTVAGDRGELSVRGISFNVNSGEIFGIGGVDGNGQAELAEALVGLRPLQSGAMKWRGGAFQPGVNPATGYIPQDRRRSGLAVTMTVEENLILDAVGERRFRRGPFLRRRALREMAGDLIQRFDIRAPGLRFPVSSLSGGNQQKIVVARALRSEPEWIVAVNPTRGLDIGATRFVWEQLRGARERGAAIVLISTDLDELAALADRTSILSAGRLTETRLTGARSEELGLLLGGIAGPVAPAASEVAPGSGAGGFSAPVPAGSDAAHPGSGGTGS